MVSLVSFQMAGGVIQRTLWPTLTRHLQNQISRTSPSWHLQPLSSTATELQEACYMNLTNLTNPTKFTRRESFERRSGSTFTHRETGRPAVASGRAGPIPGSQRQPGRPIAACRTPRASRRGRGPSSEPLLVGGAESGFSGSTCPANNLCGQYLASSVCRREPAPKPNPLRPLWSARRVLLPSGANLQDMRR